MSENEVCFLKAGEWSAVVLPRLGADVASLQCAGRDVLLPLRSEEQLRRNPYLHGSPILLPANRTRDGRFSFRGREYTLPINEKETHSHLHGFLHTYPFRVCARGQTSIRMVYDHAGDGYPFPFTITVVYSVSERGFWQHYEIAASGGTDFPLVFALHTTFVEPERFSVPLKSCQERDERLLPTGRILPLASWQERLVSGCASRGTAVTGYYLSGGHTAHIGDFDYTVSAAFDHWVLYNGGGGEGFLCVEPQCGAVDGLNTPTGRWIVRTNQPAVFDTYISRAGSAAPFV